MRKWLAVGLLGVVGCAGRVPVARLPWVAAPYHEPARARAVTRAAPAPVGSTAAPLAPAVRRPAGQETPRQAGAAQRGRAATVAPPGRPAARRVTPAAAPAARAPANHAIDGLFPLVLIAGGIVFVLLLSIVFAFAAPATILGGIGKVVLYILGGFLLISILSRIGRGDRR